MAIEIKTEDIVKLILQFCSENGLNQSQLALQKETQVSLNIVESVEKFKSDIVHGRWDLVLLEVQKLKVPSETIMELYEIIVQEMLELGENDTALCIVNEAIRPIGLFKEYTERCMRLEHLSKRQKIDISEIYMDKSTKEKRRQNIAEKLVKEVGTAPSSRLLYLLGQSLKYQEQQGEIKPNIKLNLFTGHIPPAEDEIDKPTLTIEKKLKYGGEYRIECASFSNNGKYLATGSQDGIIEIHDPVACELDKNLVYQNEQNYMIHKDAILSIQFSRDDEMIASGDKKGIIKVWRISNGKLLKKIEGVFESPITALIFGLEFSHLLAGSKQIKVIGLKSGKALREFSGHTSTVTQMVLNEESTRLVSGSSDGTIRFWDYKTAECIMNFMLPSDTQGVEPDVFNVISLGKYGIGGEAQMLVCNKSDTLNVINWQSSIQNSFSNDRKEDFISAAVSVHKNIIYGATEKNYIYCFNNKSGNLDNFFKVFEESDEIIGILHHPLRNILVIYTINGTLYFLKP